MNIKALRHVAKVTGALTIPRTGSQGMSLPEHAHATSLDECGSVFAEAERHEGVILGSLAGRGKWVSFKHRGPQASWSCKPWGEYADLLCRE